MTGNRRKRCIPEDVEEAVRLGVELALLRGQIMSPHRVKALRLLLSAAVPIKPYDLMKKLRDDGQAKPPTVYRTLEALMASGLIHRVESLGAYMPCQHWEHDHSPGFLICDRCGAVEEIDIDQVVQVLAGESESVSFAARTAAIEINGTCSKCL